MIAYMPEDFNVTYTGCMTRRGEKVKVLTLRIPESLYGVLAEKAEQGYRPVNQEIIRCLEYYYGVAGKNGRTTADAPADHAPGNGD